MSNIVEFQSNSNNESPFDSIKRFDENGQEYWLGRELMKILGYLKWQRFGAKDGDSLSVVKKAIISCKTSGNNADDHFIHLPSRVSGKG